MRSDYMTKACWNTV